MNNKEANITINGFILSDFEATIIRLSIEALATHLVKEDFVQWPEKEETTEYNRAIFNKLNDLRRYIFRDNSVSFIPLSKPEQALSPKALERDVEEEYYEELHQLDTNNKD